MRIYKGETFAEVYKESLVDLITNSDYETKPRDLKIKENEGVIMEISDPYSMFYKNKIRGSKFKYIAGEYLYYFSGRRDVEFISKFASFWKQIANHNDTVNSAYGYLLFNRNNEHNYNQWQWALRSLINDKDSRQATMIFNTPDFSYPENKDFVCTLNGMFMIRDNKLNLQVNMRSNDAILGTPTDIGFFLMLQIQAYIILKKYYPDLEMGFYRHIANSYHIYERHFELVQKMVEHQFEPQTIKGLDDHDIDLVDVNGNASDDVQGLVHMIENPSIDYIPDTALGSWMKHLIFETNE